MSLETTEECGPNPQRGANTNSLSDRAGADVTPNQSSKKSQSSARRRIK